MTHLTEIYFVQDHDLATIVSDMSVEGTRYAFNINELHHDVNELYLAEAVVLRQHMQALHQDANEHSCRGGGTSPNF